VRALVYFVAASVDGFIAGPDGAIDFFNSGPDLLTWMRDTYPETLPTAYREAAGVDAPNRRFDSVLMGRATYQPAIDAGITCPYAHLEQFVFSRTLAPVDGVTVVNADPVAKVRELKAREGRDIWLCGGGDLAGQLAGEIDEIVVKLNPVLACDGVRLVARSFSAVRLELLPATPLPSGVLVLHYRVVR
jgi:dihydrofolate reductase